LDCISESKKWKPFVSNRVEEIKRSVKSSQFGHCEGIDNPADLPSRGCSVKFLQKSALWAHGPEWLYNTDCIKPKVSADLDNLQKFAADAEECVGKHTVSLLALPKFAEYHNPENYSSWRTLLRLTTIWVSFVCRCYMLYCVKVSGGELPAIWSNDNKLKAEYFWFRYAQQVGFADDYDDLMEMQNIGLKSRLMKLRPYYDPICRLIKSRGRTIPGVCDLIILPAKHHVTRLVIYEAHMLTCHGGAALTLSKLRERFWIIKGRSEVRKVLNTCMACRIYMRDSRTRMDTEVKTLPQPLRGGTPSWRANPFTGESFYIRIHTGTRHLTFERLRN
jgi:hypothetical protein